MKDNAVSMINASPVSYIRAAKLRGSLFDPHDTRGRVSSVDTSFFIDHQEPLETIGTGDTVDLLAFRGTLGRA